MFINKSTFKKFTCSTSQSTCSIAKSLVYFFKPQQRHPDITVMVDWAYK